MESHQPLGGGTSSLANLLRNGKVSLQVAPLSDATTRFSPVGNMKLLSPGSPEDQVAMAALKKRGQRTVRRHAKASIMQQVRGSGEQRDAAARAQLSMGSSRGELQKQRLLAEKGPIPDSFVEHGIHFAQGCAFRLALQRGKYYVAHDVLSILRDAFTRLGGSPQCFDGVQVHVFPGPVHAEALVVFPSADSCGAVLRQRDSLLRVLIEMIESLTALRPRRVANRSDGVSAGASRLPTQGDLDAVVEAAVASGALVLPLKLSLQDESMERWMDAGGKLLNGIHCIFITPCSLTVKDHVLRGLFPTSTGIAWDEVDALSGSLRWTLEFNSLAARDAALKNHRAIAALKDQFGSNIRVTAARRPVTDSLFWDPSAVVKSLVKECHAAATGSHRVISAKFVLWLDAKFMGGHERSLLQLRILSSELFPATGGVSRPALIAAVLGHEIEVARLRLALYSGLKSVIGTPFEVGEPHRHLQLILTDGLMTGDESMMKQLFAGHCYQCDSNGKPEWGQGLLFGPRDSAPSRMEDSLDGMLSLRQQRGQDFVAGKVSLAKTLSDLFSRKNLEDEVFPLLYDEDEEEFEADYSRTECDRLARTHFGIRGGVYDHVWEFTTVDAYIDVIVERYFHPSDFWLDLLSRATKDAEYPTLLAPHLPKVTISWLNERVLETRVGVASKLDFFANPKTGEALRIHPVCGLMHALMHFERAIFTLRSELVGAGVLRVDPVHEERAAVVLGKQLSSLQNSTVSPQMGAAVMRHAIEGRDVLMSGAHSVPAFTFLLSVTERLQINIYSRQLSRTLLEKHQRVLEAAVTPLIVRQLYVLVRLKLSTLMVPSFSDALKHELLKLKLGALKEMVGASNLSLPDPPTKAMCVARLLPVGIELSNPSDGSKSNARNPSDGSKSNARRKHALWPHVEQARAVVAQLRRKYPPAGLDGRHAHHLMAHFPQVRLLFDIVSPFVLAEEGGEASLGVFNLVARKIQNGSDPIERGHVAASFKRPVLSAPPPMHRHRSRVGYVMCPAFLRSTDSFPTLVRQALERLDPFSRQLVAFYDSGAVYFGVSEHHAYDIVCFNRLQGECSFCSDEQSLLAGKTMEYPDDLGIFLHEGLSLEPQVDLALLPVPEEAAVDPVIMFLRRAGFATDACASIKQTDVKRFFKDKDVVRKMEGRHYPNQRASVSEKVQWIRDRISDGTASDFYQ